jgi:hypothetical protein
MTRRQQTADAWVIVVLLQHLHIGVGYAFLGVECAGAVSAGAGNDVTHLLEQAVRIVIAVRPLVLGYRVPTRLPGTTRVNRGPAHRSHH